MDLIQSFLQYFQKTNSGDSKATPEGVCPNCWGEQEYQGVVRKLYADKQIDVNNHAANHAFIQDFVVNHVDGIRLKRGQSGLECPRCKMSYDLE